MKCVIVFAISLFVIKVDGSLENRIFGGNEASPYSFPYLVSILAQILDEIHRCTGSLLNKEWVLTAAHCVAGSKTIRVLAGHSDLTADEIQERYAIWSVVHGRYARSGTYSMASHGQYDIALVKVQRPFDMFAETIGVASLSWGEWGSGGSMSCIAAGWGITDPQANLSAQRLKYARVTAKRNGCPCSYSGPRYRDLLLCLEPSGLGPCSGDSGGPLICDSEVIGITISATDLDCKTHPKCGSPSSTQVYLYACKFIDWISKFVPDVTSRCGKM